MCVQSPQTIIQYEELPKFNGFPVDSIYAEYENSRYENGNYIADILFYKVYFRGRWNNDGKSIKIKDLPLDFQPFFGIVENKGKTIFIKHISFRESDSANGSFTDDSLHIGGWANNATNSSFGLFRGCSHFMDKPENIYVIDVDSNLGKNILNILNKEYEVKEIEFAELKYNMKEGSLDFATKYPYKHTPIRWIDGCAYPDEKLPSWRWLHGMPYRQPEGRTDKKYLKVWDEDLKRHLYLEKTNEVYVGEEGLIMLDFPYKSHDIYGVEGNAYCRISRFNEKLNFVFQTYNVTEIKKTKENPVVFSSFRNMSVLKKNLRGNHNDFYRIVRIVDSITNSDKSEDNY